MTLEGKVGLVTGAAAGIGAAIARGMVEAGARVVLAGHDAAGLERLAAQLDPSGARVRTAEADVRDLAALERTVALAVEAFGALHLAVNNAGVTGPGETLLHELAPLDWETVVGTNLTGTYLSLKAEIPAILASGGGAIVNLSSGNGVVGVAGLAAYTATKHGVLGLTRSVALELAGRNVRVNAVGPGYVATERMLAMPEEALEAIGAAHPMGRLATPEEVADLTVFLLSDRAGFCTGGFYPVDGGFTAR